MSQNLKYIFAFICVLAFLGVVVYGISVYDKNKNREYDLTEKEHELSRAIDSLKNKVYHDSITVSNLLESKEVEKTNRSNYAVNKNKRDEEIYKAPAVNNRNYNREFILGFEPKFR